MIITNFWSGKVKVMADKIMACHQHEEIFRSQVTQNRKMAFKFI